MWYVYFLELSNGDVYVGFSCNLKQRFRCYNEGKVSATSSFLPAKLRSYIAVETREEAARLERYFKTGSGKAFAKKRFLNRRGTEVVITGPTRNRFGA